MDLELRVTSDTLKPHENIFELIGTPDDNGGLIPVLILDLSSPQHHTLADLIDKIPVTDFQIKRFMISDIIHGLAAIQKEKNHPR